MAQGRKMKRGRKYNFIYHIDHISFDFSFTVILKPFYIIINNSWWLQMLNVFEHEHANHSNWVENANNRFIIDIFFHFGFAFCELIKRNTHIVVYSLLLQFSSSLIFISLSRLGSYLSHWFFVSYRKCQHNQLCDISNENARIRMLCSLNQCQFIELHWTFDVVFVAGDSIRLPNSTAISHIAEGSACICVCLCVNVFKVLDRAMHQFNMSTF